MSDWIKKQERGTSWVIRFMVWLCCSPTRWLVGVLLYPIAAYFFLTGRSAHRASMHYFSLVKKRSSWFDYYHQLLCFSRCLVDRVVLLSGNPDEFQIRHQGRQQLLESRRDGQGIMMLGSHLGSFEAARLLARDRMDVGIHIVAYFGGSTKIRNALDVINPELVQNIIDPSEPDAVFKMRDVIDSGGILAILGDRTGFGDRTVSVEFLGGQADFSVGPYYLASVLRCPVFCFFGVRTGNFQYDTYAIKLADRIELERGKREEQVIDYVQNYARLLAEKARQYPYNWFNFYEFWQSAEKSKP